MKKLVAYFSATGKTAAAAKNLAAAFGADIVEIKAAQPYSAADLDYTNPKSRCSIEMGGDRSSRPEFEPVCCDVEAYDAIDLVFPIWWGVAPTIVNSFLEKYDLAGKEITVYATSGISPLGDSAKCLEPSAPGATIKDGKMLNGNPSVDEINAWINI